MAPCNSNQIADYLLAVFREAGEFPTHLKLQKLVYYAQAWYLAINDNPLMDEPFQAWIHGPVCPSLYRRFRAFGWEPITANVTKPPLDAKILEHLDEVMEAYGGFGAWELERMVHGEGPWIEARGGLPPDAISEAVISQETMKRYYRDRLEHGEDTAS